MGAPLHGGEPLLVQRLQGLHGRPDRAPGPHRRWVAQAHAHRRGGRRMGEGPVTESKATGRPSWKLKPPHDSLTQGIVVSGFVDLPAAEALFLYYDDALAAEGAGDEGKRGAWLRALGAVAPITDADGKDPRAAALAFTSTGLQKLGIPAETLATFSEPFREGMYQEDRLRRLGDRIDGKWQGTVLDGGPRWSGNTPVRKPASKGLSGATDLGRLPEPAEVQIITPTTVHALLILYDANVADLVQWAEQVAVALAPHGVQIVHRRSLDLRLDASGIGREHF